MLWKDDKKRRLEDRVGPAESVVAAGTKFKGTIRGPESVRVSGEFEGEIESQGLVRVQKDARVQARLRAPYVIIEGELTGNIEEAEHVELRARCRVVGDINAKVIAIAYGGFFEGKIKMPREEDKPIEFAEKRLSAQVSSPK
jgi:cytoskeletal protein CcmA (bactofilin family)